MKLPLILVVENNRCAFSTPLSEQYACEKLSDRAPGYGIAGETVDGLDFDAVHAAMNRAIERARTGYGATLLECMLPRMRGHAEGDGSYEMIPAAEREEYLKQDPLVRFEASLLARGHADQQRVERVTATARDIIEDAVERALLTEEPSLAEATRPVFAPGEVATAFARQSTEVTGG